MSRSIQVYVIGMITTSYTSSIQPNLFARTEVKPETVHYYVLKGNHLLTSESPNPLLIQTKIIPTL